MHVHSWERLYAHMHIRRHFPYTHTHRTHKHTCLLAYLCDIPLSVLVSFSMLSYQHACWFQALAMHKRETRDAQAADTRSATSHCKDVHVQSNQALPTTCFPKQICLINDWCCQPPIWIQTFFANTCIYKKRAFASCLYFQTNTALWCRILPKHRVSAWIARRGNIKMKMTVTPTVQASDDCAIAAYNPCDKQSPAVCKDLDTFVPNASCSCSCPIGYAGDGWPEGSGCISIQLVRDPAKASFFFFLKVSTNSDRDKACGALH
jgi:hypothetical protein